MSEADDEQQDGLQETVLETLKQQGAQIYHAYVEGGLDYDERTDETLREYLEALIETLNTHADASLERINSMLQSASFSLSDLEAEDPDEQLEERPNYEQLIDEMLDLYEGYFDEGYELVDRERRSPAERALQDRDQRSRPRPSDSTQGREFGTGSDQFFPDWVNPVTVAAALAGTAVLGGAVYYLRE